MKEIPNKSLTDTVTTASLLMVALNNPGEKGLDFSLIRARNRVADAVAKADEPGAVIKLEDADYKVAQDAVASVRWAKPDRHLIAFAEQFGL